MMLNGLKGPIGYAVTNPASPMNLRRQTANCWLTCLTKGMIDASCGSESSGFQHLGYLDVQRSADECSTESANTKTKLLHSSGQVRAIHGWPHPQQLVRV